MKASKPTKKYLGLSWIFGILHFALMFGPLCYYLPTAFMIAEPAARITMSLVFIVCAILAFIMLIVEAKTRGGLAKSILWLCILGITMALTQVQTFIYIMAIASVLDEILIVRVWDHSKQCYKINKQMDKRL